MEKAYDFKASEDGIYKKWEDSGYFNPDNLEAAEDAPNYCIVMPPPNVTGTLHMGHAVMLAVEDILVRYHRMSGARALWIPGTDHAAIATQTKVEKLLKDEETDRHALGREKFLKRVEQFARQSHDTIVNQIKKMGSSCDWGREAYTLDETRTKAVRSVFKMMHADGLIYRGERIVNWCPRCHSTLADDEVEYKSQQGKLYYFKYDRNFPVTIATTRPETKLADTAVAVNPADARYNKLIGQEYEVDFCGVKLAIKIIGDKSVDMEFGSGAVGVTPAHSLADWQMAEEHGLPVVKAIGESGRILDGFADFSGKTVFEAREAIIECLRKEALIEKEEDIVNNLSYCYRCDTPIEPLPSLQWFIDVNKPLRGRKQEAGGERQGLDIEGKTIKEIALEVIKNGNIKIVPERFEKNYFHWIENLRDWCISRQIWFGHRVPVWYKKKPEVRSKKSEETLNDSFDSIPQNLEIYVGLEEPEGEGWVQDEDTLDTWFSSGLWTFSTLAKSPDDIIIEKGKLKISSQDFKKYHPTAVLETGYDILFFWIARMIIMTTYAVGDIPFHDVYLHGLVLDEQGKKMSKSRGNVIDPLDMIAKYGTDTTRLSLVIGSAPGSDLKLSEEKIAGYRNFVNKLWNIARYILVFGPDLSGKNPAASQGDLTASDCWIAGKMAGLIREVTADLGSYRFSQAGEKLRDFTWGDLADWHLEASKFSQGQKSRELLMLVFSDLLKLWHPFIPFVTENIWEKFSDSLLMVESWPDASAYEGYLDTTSRAEREFEMIKGLVSAIRNARSENKLTPGQKIKLLVITDEFKDLLIKNDSLIKGLRTSVGEIEVSSEKQKPASAIFLPLTGMEAYLIAGIDPARERKRLEKEIEEARTLLAGVQARLDNAEFVEKAPASIVLKEKEKSEEYRKKIKSLEKQLLKIN